MKRYIWFVDFRKTIQERVASCRAPKSLVKLFGDGSIPVEFRSRAFIRLSRAGAGSLLSFLYVFSSFSMSIHLPLIPFMVQKDSCSSFVGGEDHQILVFLQVRDGFLGSDCSVEFLYCGEGRLLPLLIP